jgi:hypothetical protein
MTPGDLLQAIEERGGSLTIEGGRVKGWLPEEAKDLLPALRASRDEIYGLLAKRQQIPKPPSGVRILAWKLLEPPVILTKFSVVIDPDQFARSTLEQLGHALAGRHWLAGSWTVRDLVERLAQVGVELEVPDVR